MDYSFFEEMFKSFNNGNNNCNNNTPPGAADEECRNSNSDIPGGFQDMPPQLVAILGEILGNAMAGRMPFNVQNIVGNWLELVGQAILTINAQEQYFYAGPGRYYNPIYRNCNNPFCPTDGSNVGTTSSGLEDKVKKLQEEVDRLKDEIKELKQQK